MSFCSPRCKAFSRKISDRLWQLIAFVVFCMWAFYIYQIVASFHEVLP